MKTRAGFLVASFLAVVMCSCVSQAELDKARAEAEAARAEAEKAKVEVQAAKAKAKAEEKAKAKAEELKRKDAQDKAMAGVMKPWNVAVGDILAHAPNLGVVNFLWNDLDAFPHPTYRGDTAAVYGVFAKAYLKFLQEGDNFEYLAKNDLFTAELRYASPDGQHSTWTFLKLAEQLSDPKGFGTHNEATRKALKGYADKMKAPPKS